MNGLNNLKKNKTYEKITIIFWKLFSFNTFWF